ncbi:hypothetical protein [Streptomyces sp. NPDC051636]|uniref:hypothetical protein n=1 Tax=Streptomyces sp. NPDC051636 TaxID=3365663 RepID=UPI00378FFCF2
MRDAVVAVLRRGDRVLVIRREPGSHSVRGSQAEALVRDVREEVGLPEEFLALDPVFDGDREFFDGILPGLGRDATG